MSGYGYDTPDHLVGLLVQISSAGERAMWDVFWMYHIVVAQFVDSKKKTL